MRKKFSVLSLVVSGAMVFSLAGVGCKKAEQPAEAPKQAEQASAPAPAMEAPAAPVKGFSIANGTLEKGGLGFILSAEKDKGAVAAKPTGKSYKSVMTVKAKIKAAQPAGTRNGFIVFGEKPGEWSKAGILIGGMKYGIDGPLVEKVEVPQKFDPNKVFDVELTVDLKGKTVAFKIDGSEVKTKMTKAPASINYVGYSAGNTKTEFSELEVSGN